LSVTLTPNEHYANLPQIPATNVRGTIKDTITINELTETIITDRPDAT